MKKNHNVKKKFTKSSRKTRYLLKKKKLTKAKNKYAKDIILQIGGMKKNRVLIVVDVQQCFFENFGTMGWLPKDYLKATTNESRDEANQVFAKSLYYFKKKETSEDNSNAKTIEKKRKLNERRDNVKQEFARRLNDFIENAKLKYDIIIFTKDRHPIGHRSFGTYPPHCIDEHKTCNSPYIQNTKKDLQSLRDVATRKNTQKGHKLILANSTDLEKLDYDYKISYGGNINDKDKINQTKLIDLDLKGQIKYEQKDQRKTKIETLDIEKLEIKHKDTATIVRLNKGELCNFDAYGAFVYHVEYKESSRTRKNERRNANVYSSRHEYDPSGETNILDSLDNKIEDLSKISTGLGEFLLKYYDYEFAEDMVIDVCGLVTNICVVNSCIGGIKFFENVNTLFKSGLKSELKSELKVPHFRILNEYSLYLYVFPLSEMQCLKNAKISYEIYKDENEYPKDNQSRLTHSVSIIGTKDADDYGYEPLPYSTYGQTITNV